MRTHKIEFLKKSAILATLFLVLLLLVNSFYVAEIFREKNINRNFEQFNQEDKGELEILFFGDSHPARAINPEYIPDSFNFAVPGETYDQTYYKIRWVVNNYEDIDTFVIPYDYHSFNLYRKNSYYEVKHWVRFMSYDELSISTNKSKFRLLLTANIPVIGNGAEILEYFLSAGNKTEIYKGWQKETRLFTSQKNMTEAGIKRVEFQMNNDPEIKDELFFDYFLRSIDFLENNNKTIILIKYPVTEEYLFALRNIGVNKSWFYAEQANLEENTNNLYLLDFQEFYKNNKSLFSNSDHLNVDGAKIFSASINQEIMRISSS